MQRSKALKRLNICAGSIKPSLFAYPHTGYNKHFISPTLLHALHSRKLISACSAKFPYFTYSLFSEAEPGHILSCVVAQYYAQIRVNSPLKDIRLTQQHISKIRPLKFWPVCLSFSLLFLRKHCDLSLFVAYISV